MEIEVLFEDQPIFFYFKRKVYYAKSQIKEHLRRKKLNFFMLELKKK